MFLNYYSAYFSALTFLMTFLRSQLLPEPLIVQRKMLRLLRLSHYQIKRRRSLSIIRMDFGHIQDGSGLPGGQGGLVHTLDKRNRVEACWPSSVFSARAGRHHDAPRVDPARGEETQLPLDILLQLRPPLVRRSDGLPHTGRSGTERQGQQGPTTSDVRG